MKNLVLEVIDFVKGSFPDAIIRTSDNFNSADVFIDCLEEKRFEITLDVRPFGVRVGRVDKSILLGDFSSFELTFFELEELRRFLINCKVTGKFEI